MMQSLGLLVWLGVDPGASILPMVSTYQAMEVLDQLEADHERLVLEMVAWLGNEHNNHHPALLDTAWEYKGSGIADVE